MPTVTMPQLGESVEEGTIGKWLKNVGDHVAVGDPLVEVITDKVNAEVPSPFEGTLTKILADEGATVANDAPLAEVGEAEAAATPDAPAPDADAASTTDEDAATATDAGSAPAAVPDAASTTDGGAADAASTTDEGTSDAASTTDEDTIAGEASAEEDVAAGEPAQTRDAGEPAGDASAADDAGDGSASRPSPASSSPSSETTEVATPAAAGTNGSGGDGVATTAVATAAISPVKARMTPAVRRLAREHAVDLTLVTGSGIGGRITREDVERAVEEGKGGTASAAAVAAMSPAPAGSPAAATGSATPAAPPPAPTAPAPESPVAHGDSLKKLSMMRKAIAKQMTRSLEVPTAYIMVEVDMTNVVRRRTTANPEYKAREGMSLSYVAFVTKACVEALRRHPDINGHWTDEGHWRRKAINVGIAVAVDDGLLVPVIRDADTLSLHGLNTAINDLAKRSRDKRIQPDELRGGTFTVDNTGWTGSILTLPIINVPEVAIITMEKVVKRPVVIEGPSGDAIAVRQMMNMCIAIDHRATDGAQAGEFLRDVREWLEAVDDDTPIW